MKIYNVNVYDVNHYYKVESEMYISIKKVDKIVVVKDLFGVREAVTNLPLNVYKDNYVLTKKYIKHYMKYKLMLGVNKRDLINKNLATSDILDKYASMFVWSNFRKFVKVYDDQKYIDNKIRKIKKLNR